MRLLAAVVLGLVCSVSVASADQFKGAPENWRSPVKAAMMSALKDPDSARGLVVSNIFNTGNRYRYKNVWAACARVNARNSYGGYTGTREYVAYFRNGSVFDIMGPTSSRQGNSDCQGFR